MPSATSSSRRSAAGEPLVRNESVRRYRMLATIALVSIVAGSTVGILVPAGQGWDFGNFYDTGRRVAAGQIADLYDSLSWIAGEPPQGRMRFWGTPLSAWLYWPLSFLSPEAALVAFKFQNAIVYFAGLVLSFFHLRRVVGPSPLDRWRFTAFYAVLALVYQPFWTVYRVGGQSTPTIFLLVVVSLICHTTGRFAPSAALLVLAVFVKPAFAPLLLLLVLVSGIRFAVWTGAALAAAGSASIALMGWSIHGEFLSLVTEGFGTTRYGWYNCSVYAWIQHLELLDRAGFTRGSLDPVVTIAKLLVAAAFAALVLRGRSSRLPARARRHFEFLVALAFFLLLSGILWEHYLSVLFPMLAYVVAVRRYFPREAMWWVAGIVLLAGAQSVIVIEFLRGFFRLDSPSSIIAVGMLKSSPLLLLVAFLGRHWRELLRSHEAVS